MKYFNLYAKFQFLYFICTPFNHLLLRFWFYLRYKIVSTFYLTFTLLSFNLLYFISTPSNRSPTCVWFYLRYKIRKLYKAQCCPFPMFLKVVNFFLPYLCSVFHLLGRKPVVWIFSTNYAKFFCLFLLWLCINILRDFGESCESVPLDHSGSYVSISINIYN